MSIEEHPAEVFRLPYAFKLALFGATGSGKSHLISDLLANLDQCLTKTHYWGNIGILYCYRSRLPENLKVNAHVTRSLPTVDDIISLKQEYNYNTLIMVVDDLMIDMKKFSPDKAHTEQLCNLFIDGARTLGVCLVVTFQVLYPNCELARMFIRNCTAQVFFNWTNDMAGMRRKIATLCANDDDFYKKAYMHCISKPNGYCYIDTFVRSSCPQELRFRNFLFPFHGKDTDSKAPVHSLSSPGQQDVLIPPGARDTVEISTYHAET